MAREWKFDTEQGIYISTEGDWLEYGAFGSDTYGLHTTIDGREAIFHIGFENPCDEADELLDMFAGNWRPVNWGQRDENLLSISEAAHLLKVSRQRVHVMLQSGKLDGVKVGSTWIIHRDSVEGYMARK
jgi:excisionase family DNA binding protein